MTASVMCMCMYMVAFSLSTLALLAVPRPALHDHTAPLHAYMLKSVLHAYRTAILERCLRRLEFDKARDAEAKAQADQLEAERMAMQSIDWWVLALLPNGSAPAVLQVWYSFWEG